MNAYKNASFVGIVLMLVGVGLMVYAGSFLIEEKELDERGIVATGEVFAIEQKDFYRQAWVVFTTDDGQEVRFLSKLMVDMSLFKYHVGQKVDVIYDPANPTPTAEINAFFERNTRQVWVGFVATVLLLVGFLLRRSLLKKARKQEAIQRGEARSDAREAQSSLNKIMLTTFLFICLLIGVLVYVYGVHGNETFWDGPSASEAADPPGASGR